MLTGDKLETAINIARASHLVEEADLFAALVTAEENATEEEVIRFFHLLRHYVILLHAGG